MDLLSALLSVTMLSLKQYGISSCPIFATISQVIDIVAIHPTQVYLAHQCHEQLMVPLLQLPERSSHLHFETAFEIPISY